MIPQESRMAPEYIARLEQLRRERPEQWLKWSSLWDRRPGNSETCEHKTLMTYPRGHWWHLCVDCGAEGVHESSG